MQAYEEPCYTSSSLQRSEAASLQATVTRKPIIQSSQEALSLTQYIIIIIH